MMAIIHAMIAWLKYLKVMRNELFEFWAIFHWIWSIGHRLEAVPPVVGNHHDLVVCVLLFECIKCIFMSVLVVNILSLN